jgi:hypothetical protein
VTLTLRTRTMLVAMMGVYALIFALTTDQLVSHLSLDGLGRFWVFHALGALIGIAAIIDAVRRTKAGTERLASGLEAMYVWAVKRVPRLARGTTPRVRFAALLPFGLMSTWDWICCCAWCF